MEVAEKDYARAAWRESQRRKSRKRFTDNKLLTKDVELESNQDRYREGNAIPEQEPGQYTAISTGADLAKLLQESLHSDRSLHFRSRRLLDAEALQVLPSSVITDAEQALTVDFAALEDSLLLLPTHELLGVEQQLWPQSMPSNNGVTAAFSEHRPDRQKRPDGTAKQAAASDCNSVSQSNEAVSGRHNEEEVTSLRQTTIEELKILNHFTGVAPIDEAGKALQGGLQARQVTESTEAPKSQTSLAEQEFEQLMVAEDLLPSTAKTYLAPSRQRPSPSDDVANSQHTLYTGAANATEIGQTKDQVDDLESWLDSL